jgi:hypothetical protein
VKRTIEYKRKGKIPPFLAHPILCIFLFIIGSNPYTLIDQRRNYGRGVEHEFGDIISSFKGITTIDNFYTWFDHSLTAEDSFDRFFRTGTKASDFVKYAISNNTFSVLAITQGRTGCDVVSSSSDWRCGVANKKQCQDITCTAANGTYSDGVCVLDMVYADVNNPSRGLNTPQPPPNLTNYELADACVLQQFIHPNSKAAAAVHTIHPTVNEKQAFTLIPANLWHRDLTDVQIGTLFSQSLQDAHYIDVNTRSVTIWVVARAESIVHGSICLLDFTIEFSATGAVSPTTSISPMVHFFEEEPYTPRLPYYLYLIYAAFSNLREIQLHVRGGTVKKYLVYDSVDVSPHHIDTSFV